MKKTKQYHNVKSNRGRDLSELVSLPDDALIGVNEAALLMGRSRETVRRWRKLGIGPTHLKHPLGLDYAQYQIGKIRNWIINRQDKNSADSLAKHSKSSNQNSHS